MACVAVRGADVMVDFTATHVRQMLFAYMGANELTQKELAKMIGISGSHLNGILHEAKEPYGKVLDWLKLQRVVVYRRSAGGR